MVLKILILTMIITNSVSHLFVSQSIEMNSLVNRCLKLLNIPKNMDETYYALQILHLPIISFNASVECDILDKIPSINDLDMFYDFHIRQITGYVNKPRADRKVNTL